MTILNSQNLKLDIVIKEVFDSKVAAGMVISTDPVNGAELVTGQKVTLKVSKGPELKKVPKVENLTIGDADTILTNAGFKYKWEPQYSTTVDKNLVISQSVAPETEADVNVEIVLVISKGPMKKTINIPSTVDKDGCKVEITDAKGNVVYKADLKPTDTQITLELGGTGKQTYTVKYIGLESSFVENFEVDFDK